MPLKKGGGQEAAHENIEEIMHSWQKTGAIGTSHPKNKQAAQKQAVAIGLKAAGVSKGQKAQQSPKHETIGHKRAATTRSSSHSSKKAAA